MPSQKLAKAPVLRRGPFDVTQLKRAPLFLRALRSNRTDSWLDNVVSQLRLPAEVGSVQLEASGQDLQEALAQAFGPLERSTHRRRLRELARASVEDERSTWFSALLSFRLPGAERPSGYFGVRIGMEVQASRELTNRGEAMQALTATLSFQLMDAVLFSGAMGAARSLMDRALAQLLTAATLLALQAVDISVEVPGRSSMTRVLVELEGLGGFGEDTETLGRVLEMVWREWDGRTGWRRDSKSVFRVRNARIETVLGDPADLSDPDVLREGRFSWPGNPADRDEGQSRTWGVHDVAQDVPANPVSEAEGNRLLDAVRATQKALQLAQAQYSEAVRRLPPGMRCWQRGPENASPVIVYVHREDGSVLACSPGTLRLVPVDPGQLYTPNDARAHLPQSK